MKVRKNLRNIDSCFDTEYVHTVYIQITELAHKNYRNIDQYRQKKYRPKYRPKFKQIRERLQVDRKDSFYSSKELANRSMNKKIACSNLTWLLRLKILAIGCHTSRSVVCGHKNPVKYHNWPADCILDAPESFREKYLNSVCVCLQFMLNVWWTTFTYTLLISWKPDRSISGRLDTSE